MSRIISQNPDFSPRKELLQPNTGIANAVDFSAATHDSPLATPQPVTAAEQERQAYDADFESLHAGLNSLFSQLADATADTDDSATNLSENSDKNSMSGACNSTANSAKDGVSSTSAAEFPSNNAANAPVANATDSAANSAPNSANCSATDSAANATGNATVNGSVPKAANSATSAAEFSSSNANATAPTATKPNAGAKIYGKFANAQELYKGYVQLEKSYTHKCQQLSQTLKTLQNLRDAQTPSAAADSAVAPSIRTAPPTHAASHAPNVALADVAPQTDSDVTALQNQPATPSAQSAPPTHAAQSLQQAADGGQISAANAFAPQQIPGPLPNGGGATIGVSAAPSGQKPNPTLQNFSSLSQTNSIPAGSSSSPTGGTSENSPPSALSPAVTVSDSSKSTESHGNGATLLDALTTLQQLLAHLPEVASVLQHKGVSNNRAPAVIGGGGAVTVAAPSKPKTVSQASALAHELLK